MKSCLWRSGQNPRKSSALFSARWVLLTGKQRMFVKSQSGRPHDVSRALPLSSGQIPLNSDMSPTRGEETDVPRGILAQMWGSVRSFPQDLCFLSSFVQWSSVVPLPLTSHDSQQAGHGEKGSVCSAGIHLGSVSGYCFSNMTYNFITSFLA